MYQYLDDKYNFELNIYDLVRRLQSQFRFSDVAYTLWYND